jgi:hypothetical protein
VDQIVQFRTADPARCLPSAQLADGDPDKHAMQPRQAGLALGAVCR